MKLPGYVGPKSMDRCPNLSLAVARLAGCGLQAVLVGELGDTPETGNSCGKPLSVQAGDQRGYPHPCY